MYEENYAVIKNICSLKNFNGNKMFILKKKKACCKLYVVCQFQNYIPGKSVKILNVSVC